MSGHNGKRANAVIAPSEQDKVDAALHQYIIDTVTEIRKSNVQRTQESIKADDIDAYNAIRNQKYRKEHGQGAILRNNGLDTGEAEALQSREKENKEIRQKFIADKGKSAGEAYQKWLEMRRLISSNLSATEDTEFGGGRRRVSRRSGRRVRRRSGRRVRRRTQKRRSLRRSRRRGRRSRRM